MKMAPMDS
jgi:hypothetical protein